MSYDAADFPITDPTTITNPLERLIFLRDFLARSPDAMFNYAISWPEDKSLLATGNATECETPLCILGWARVFWPPEDEDDSYPDLGLDLFREMALFFYGYSGGTSPTRLQAVATLTHLLSTGEVNWKAPSL